MRTTQTNRTLPLRANRASWAGLISIQLLLWQCAAGQYAGSVEGTDRLIVESGAGGKVIERVRAGAPGTVVEVFVSPGQLVKQGQLLAHTELDATKLQLDLAQAALEAKGNVEATEGQAEAWTVTREETEEAVRRRKADKTRLAWAEAMEKMHRGNHQVQLDIERAQEIQFAHWKDQYEKRFFRAPVDGVVTEVLVAPGKSVGIAAHAFTVRNDNLLSVPVTVPNQIASRVAVGETLPVRPLKQNASTRATVGGVTDCLGRPGEKTVRLLLPVDSLPAAFRPKLVGSKFEVLFLNGEDAAGSPPANVSNHYDPSAPSTGWKTGQ